MSTPMPPSGPMYPMQPPGPVYPPVQQLPKQLGTVKVILLVCGIFNLLAAGLVLLSLAAVGLISSDVEVDVSVPAVVFSLVASLGFGIAYLVLSPKVGRGEPQACKTALWLVIASLALRVINMIISRNLVIGLGALLEIWMIASLLSADVKAYLKSLAPAQSR